MSGERQLEFKFMEKIKREFPNLDKDNIDQAMEEITDDARQEFVRLMDKYNVSREDRDAIRNYANWSI